MRYIHERGSFDAFIEGLQGSLAEPFAELYCEAAGDYERIVEAFADVSVSPHESMCHWVGQPESDFPYKQTKTHWHNVTTGIFR
jgi:hypothetical protein